MLLAVGLVVTASAARADDASPHIPDIEDLEEAYRNGLIDYQDYRELLEIIGGGDPGPRDSLYLRQFPDLMTATTAQSLLQLPAEISPAENDSASPEAADATDRRRHRVLVRQSQRLTEDAEAGRLVRVVSENDRISLYGEYDRTTAGRRRWTRRYLEYRLPERGGRLVVGNFRARTGLGLVCGYHGQLLPRASERSDGEKFVYPTYGGANGLLVTRPFGRGDASLAYSRERNDAHVADFLLLSVPVPTRIISMHLAFGQGRIRNRLTGARLRATYASLSGNLRRRRINADWEVAVADYLGGVPLAAAGRLRWTRPATSLTLSAWHYQSAYPSYFAGGPSARRSRRRYAADIDLSYGDRYGGETGVIINSSQALTARTDLILATAYSHRAVDDNRAEARAGLRRAFSGTYQIKLDCIIRKDNVYSYDKVNSSIQCELRRRAETSGGRLVVGYRYDRSAGRSDYLILIEAHIADRWGRWRVQGKLDRIDPGATGGRYGFTTVAHETRLGERSSLLVKYSYRYRGGDAAGTYGAIRWDFSWRL